MDQQMMAEGLWATDREIALSAKHMLRALLGLPAGDMKDKAIKLLRESQAAATLAATRQISEPLPIPQCIVRERDDQAGLPGVDDQHATMTVDAEFVSEADEPSEEPSRAVE